MHAMTPLNDCPHVVALENALRVDSENLRGYREPINALLRDVRSLRSRAERVDALEAKVKRLSEKLEAAMRHNA